MTSHRRLLEAVLDLDTVNYPRLYETNVDFHVSVDTLVRVLMPLTRLLADEAIRNERERSQAEALLREGLQRWP